MKLRNLSVFFPAYNEQDNIANTVRGAFQVIPDVAEEFEIIVVDDGSTDKTSEALGELAREHNNLRVIGHERNKGYGGALKTGFRATRYQYVFFTDGDGQFDIREIKNIVPLISECDIVAGFRIKRQDPIYRVFNGKAYNFLVRLLFGLDLRDIDCAFKLIKKEVLNSVDLKSDSQFLSAEFLIKAKKKGFVIREYGVRHLPRRMGKATGNNPLVVIRSFRELFKLWNELRHQ